jgi:preprotein translocase subunit SecB
MAAKKAATGKTNKKAGGKTKDEGDSGAQAGTDAATAQQQTRARPQDARINVLAQFVKDLSFESPNAPASLRSPGENPKLQVNVNVHAAGQGEDVYEVALHFEANATSDASVIYNIELVYAGLFRLHGIPQEMLQPVLFIDCPALLFPYLRRIVCDLTQEGGFPPLYLDPIDFAGLYRQNAPQTGQQQAAPES